MPRPRRRLSAAVLGFLALSLLALTAAAPLTAAASAQVQSPPHATPPAATPPPPAPPVTPPAAEVEPPVAPAAFEVTILEEPAPVGPTEPAPVDPAPKEPAEEPKEPAEEPEEPAEEPEEPDETAIEGPEIDPVTGMPIGTPGYESGPTGARGPAAGGGKRLATVGDEPSLSLAIPDEPPEAAPAPSPASPGQPPPPSITPMEVQPGTIGTSGGSAIQPTVLLGSGDSDRTTEAVLPSGSGGGPAFPPAIPDDAAESVVAAPFAGAVGVVAGALGAGIAAGGGETGSGVADAGAGADSPASGGAGDEREASPVGSLIPEDLGLVFGDGLNDLLIGVPNYVWILLAVLGVISLLFALAYLLATARARSLGRQRRELLQEVGLLQSALLPPVPDKLGGLRTSVAYRPADGPGAGGDFYDVLPLAGGSVGFILGDVSGHGRGALARTAFMRYTLRAYLEAGLEPRVALQVAGRVIDENLGGDFATVLLAVHDAETGSLTYATAGHPSPIVIGPQPHQPVTAGSSPPIGVGIRTGLRQTTLPLGPGGMAALFTDGLMEARVDGVMLGRERLEALLEELGEGATARSLIERVAEEAGKLSDDIAAVVVSPTVVAAAASTVRTEQLELSKAEMEGEMAGRFLAACGVPEHKAAGAVEDARVLAQRFGGAIMRVVFGEPMRVEVFPSNVETIESASRRAAAG